MDNNIKKEKEEYLEALWHMREQEISDMNDLQIAIGNEFNTYILDLMLADSLIKIEHELNSVSLTKEGELYARRIVRAHRLAERLFYDVLGCELEAGACEFEHTVTPELVEAICTLLGHPKICPHGLTIPDGVCCRQAIKSIESPTIPMIELNSGQAARIAYVNIMTNQSVNKLYGLQIRPGTIITLQQRYPVCIIECEGAIIALDNEIASRIFLWKEIEIKDVRNESYMNCVPAVEKKLRTFKKSKVKKIA